MFEFAIVGGTIACGGYLEKRVGEKKKLDRRSRINGYDDNFIYLSYHVSDSFGRIDVAIIPSP